MDYLLYKINNIISSLKLGVSLIILNCIYLSFLQIYAAFYFNYINYSGLLIFRCHNVAANELHL